VPAHQRVQREAQQDEKGPKISGKAQGIFSGINADIRALNSSILVISQKLKYIVRNEKILSRNLLVLNRKLKALQGQGFQGQNIGSSSIAPELESLSKTLSSNSEAIARLQSELEYVKQNYSKAEEVQEMKYVIDSINPLEFVKLKDVEEIVSEKLSGAKGKKKK